MGPLTGFEFDVVGDFRGGNVQDDGVVGLDDWIRVTDGAAVVGDQEWNVLGAQLGLLHFAQFVLRDRETQLAFVTRARNNNKNPT